MRLRRSKYFRMPCPLCGDPFDGGPQRTGAIATDKDGLWKMICHQCTAERQQYAEEVIARCGATGDISCGRPDGRMVRHTFPFAQAET